MHTYHSFPSPHLADYHSINSSLDLPRTTIIQIQHISPLLSRILNLISIGGRLSNPRTKAGSWTVEAAAWGIGVSGLIDCTVLV